MEGEENPVGEQKHVGELEKKLREQVNRKIAQEMRDIFRPINEVISGMSGMYFTEKDILKHGQVLYASTMLDAIEKRIVEEIRDRRYELAVIDFIEKVNGVQDQIDELREVTGT